MFGRMKRSVRLTDVAKAAQVSQGTASNVFNRPELVRQEVRDRVLASARTLGYSGPDPRGRLLRAGKANAIGIVTSKEMARLFLDPYYRQLLAGVAEVCDTRGAGMALVSASSHEQAAWTVETALVDGFIVHCLDDGDRLIELARKRELPFVAIDLDAGPDGSSVLIDDRGGAALAANHLLRLGHRRFAIAVPETHVDGRFGLIDAARVRSAYHQVGRDRLAGYEAALAEHGIAFDSVPIVEAPNHRPAAVGYLVDLLASAPEVTAILAMSDVLALAAIDAASAHGVRVPDQLSVVGFDDIPEAATATPALTTIAQPIADKGRRAATLIFEPGEPRNEILKVKLVKRASTARAREPRSPR